MKEFADFVRKSNNSDFAPTPTWNDAVSLVGSIPSAKPERKKGKWIRHITTGLGPKLNDTIECSECRIAFSTENMFRRSFCPNCGADMRGESE